MLTDRALVFSGVPLRVPWVGLLAPWPPFAIIRKGGERTWTPAQPVAHVFRSDCQQIAHAGERTSADAAVVVDAANAEALLSLESNQFSKAVCTTAIMDMPEIGPLFATLSRMLVPVGASCSPSPIHASIPRQSSAAVMYEEPGRHVIRSGVKVSSYLSSFARKTEGIIGATRASVVLPSPDQQTLPIRVRGRLRG